MPGVGDDAGPSSTTAPPRPTDPPPRAACGGLQDRRLPDRRCRGDLRPRSRRHRPALDAGRTRGRVAGEGGVLHDRLVAHDRPELLPLDAHEPADDHGRDAAVRQQRRRPARGRPRREPQPRARRPDRPRANRARGDRAGIPRRCGRRLIQGSSAAGSRGVIHSTAVDLVAAGQSNRGLYADYRGHAGRRRLLVAARPRRRARRRDDPGRGVRVGPPAGADDRARWPGLGVAARDRNRARRPPRHAAHPRPRRDREPRPGRRPAGDLGRPLGGRGGDARRRVRRHDRPASRGRRDARAAGGGPDGRTRGGEGRGGLREPGEERVPRRDEPRDSNADERRDRDERAAPRHAARRRATRLHGDDPHVGRGAADDHQRHPRLLEDRGGRFELDAHPFSLAATIEGRST